MNFGCNENAFYDIDGSWCNFLVLGLWVWQIIYVAAFPTITETVRLMVHRISSNQNIKNAVLASSSAWPSCVSNHFVSLVKFTLKFNKKTHKFIRSIGFAWIRFFYFLLLFLMIYLIFFCYLSLVFTNYIQSLFDSFYWLFHSFASYQIYTYYNIFLTSFCYHSSIFNTIIYRGKEKQNERKIIHLNKTRNIYFYLSVLMCW